MGYILQGQNTEGKWWQRDIAPSRRKPYPTREEALEALRAEAAENDWLVQHLRIVPDE